MTIQDRRLYNQALTLAAKGQVPARVRQILKEYARNPGHRISLHDHALVQKYVNQANGVRPTPETRPAKVSTQIKIDEATDALLKEALLLSAKTPPASIKVRETIARYARRGIQHLNLTAKTRSMVVSYVAHAKAPIDRGAPNLGADIGAGLSGRVEVIGPEDAFDILLASERSGFKNRPPSQAAISHYAYLMKQRRWVNTTEPIIIGRGGELLNGNQRLNAVIESGIPTEFVLIRGADPEVFWSMDQGKTRTAADVIGISGLKNSVAVAAIARLLWLWEEGGPAAVATGAHSKVGKMLGNKGLLDYVNTHPDLGRAARMSLRVKHLGPGAPFGFCAYVTARVNQTASDEFFNKLIDGSDIRKGEPIHTLRARLVSDRSDANVKQDSISIIRMVLYIWNAWRDGKALSRMPGLQGASIVTPK